MEVYPTPITKTGMKGSVSKSDNYVSDLMTSSGFVFEFISQPYIDVTFEKIRCNLNLNIGCPTIPMKHLSSIGFLSLIRAVENLDRFPEIHPVRQYLSTNFLPQFTAMQKISTGCITQCMEQAIAITRDRKNIHVSARQTEVPQC